MGETLTLSEIIHRHVTIEWTEGVAVVRAVIEHLLGSQRQASTVPELHQVRLTAHGSVEVDGGYKSDEPVRRLGQLLQATLGSSAPPVQLRLVISRATAPTPDFRTILEFDTALEYYERPDRAGMVSALFERAHAAPMATTPGVNATLDSLAPLPSVADKRPGAPIRRKINPRIFRIAAAALILGIAAAAGLRYALAAGAVEVDSGVPQAAAEVAVKASETVGEAVVKGISAVTERVGLGRLVSPDDAPSPPPGAVTPPPDPNKAKAVVRQPAATLRTGATVAQVFDLEPLPIVESEDPSSTAASSPPVLESSSNGSTASVDPLTVYTSASIDVLPPVSLNLPLTRELPPDLRKEDLTRIELLIAMDGTVEWVRLVGQPQTVHDTMWLSAVKAWLFQPAQRNGIPVRFRKTIWIAPR
jgi:hypothetical protein